MVAWLSKAQLEGPWSPGAIQSSRAVCFLETDEPSSDVCIVAALGSQVSAYKVASPKNVRVKQGKEGVFLPVPTQVTARCPIPALASRSEVMSLALHGCATSADALVAAADTLGHCVVGRLAVAGNEVVCRETSACVPATPSAEPGWTGACFAPGGASLLATARRYSRMVDLYDGDIHVRTVHTAGHPSAIQFMPLGGDRQCVLAVAETSQISVLDLRVPDSGCFVQRVVVPGPGPVHAIAATTTAGGAGLVAAAGEARNVHIYEPRTWMPLKRWLGASRQVLAAGPGMAGGQGGYDWGLEALTPAPSRPGPLHSPELRPQAITGLEFSHEDPDFLYVAASDCEVVCRKWNIGAQGRGKRGAEAAAEAAAAATPGARAQGCSFRGDHRWVGFCRTPRAEVVAAVTQNGAAYVAHRGLAMVAEVGGGGGGAEDEQRGGAAAADGDD